MKQKSDGRHERLDQMEQAQHENRGEIGGGKGIMRENKDN